MSAEDASFAEQSVFGEELESVFGWFVEDDASQVYCECDDLLYVLEFDGAGLLEENLVLLAGIDESDFCGCFSVAVCQLDEKDKLFVADGESWGVDGLDDVDDAGHTGKLVEYDPVTDNCREQNWRYVRHLQILKSVTSQVIVRYHLSRAAQELI